MSADIGKSDFYNKSYQRGNYFRYPTWIYAPYVSSLIAFCGLEKGGSVLDVGCGQGFFSYLFSKQGMRVHGIDISETGIRAAEILYERFGITFAVSDIKTAVFTKQFDCIFVRSCSLYNSATFPLQNEITDNLLSHLKVGGTFIFAYNSNFSSRLSPKWRYHSLEDVHQHFRCYSNAKIFFLNKITTCILRKYSINPFITRLNTFLSRTSGVGGDLVCILKKTTVASAVGPRTGHAELQEFGGTGARA
jgi:SAM-dependent methyltransferase